jgi:hypothetical protein
MVAPYDHVRVDGRPATPTGVYRVVGVDDDRVTLLQVGDDDGRRVHTGHVERVARSTVESFEPVDAPDATGSLAALSDSLEGLVLTARLAPGRLAARPLQAGAGLLLLLVGWVGPSVLGADPRLAFEAVEVLGVALLAAAAAGLPWGR